MNGDIATVLTALQATGPRLAASARATEARWRRQPAGGGWSAHETLAHLRASDDIRRPRLLQVVVRDAPLLIGLDDKPYQQLTGYDRLPAVRLVAGFTSARDELLHALRALPPDAWQRAGIHEWRGPRTLLQLAQEMASHEADHLAQLEAALAAPA